jgi:hypothetical protein
MTDTTTSSSDSPIMQALLAPPAAAPAAAGGGDASVQKFVADYGPLADRVSKSLGVAPQVLLGQWGLETGWGKSVIPGTNNLGNVKSAGPQAVRAVDNQTGSSDSYARYGSADDFGDHFTSLIGRRYQGAVGAGSDAQQYFGALQQGGYAEDQDYASKGVAAANMAAGAMGLPADQGVSAPAAPVAPHAPHVINVGGNAPAPSPIMAAIAQHDYYADPDGQQYLDDKAPPPPTTLQRIAGGFKRGLNQSEGLAAGAGALIKKTVTGDDAPDLLAYSQKKMEEGAGDGLAPAPSFTDVLEGKGSTGDWIADSAGYLGYQMLESILTGGVGSIVGKTVAKGAVEAVAKGAVEKQIASIAATDAGKAMTREQIASQAAKTVAGQLGAANAIFANNVRQEAGSIYGDAIKNSQQPGGQAPDLTKVWLSSLAAAGVDTAADLSMAKGLLGMREGSSAASYLGRAATEVPKDVIKQGATEYAQNEIETYGAGGDPLSKDTLYSGINDASVGALGGLLGGHLAAVHAHPAVAHAAQDPNSPLSKAALAGASSKATLEAANPPSAPAADPITGKAAAIKQQVQSGGLLDALRGADAPVDTKTFLNDLAVAQSPSSPAHLREQAMSRLEFAMSWAGQNAPAAPADTAAAAGGPLEAAAPRSAATTPAMRQAGVDRETQLLAQLQAATTPGDRDAIQRQIDENRQMNLGTPLAAAPAAPAASPVEFTGTDPGTSLGAAPDKAQTPDNAIAPPDHQFNPALATDHLALADDSAAAHASAPAAQSAPDTGDLSLVPKEPTAHERAASETAAAHEATNDASMSAHERTAQADQATADAGVHQDAADAAARAAERPGADAVVAALKPQPFERTADQKATIARAEATYHPDEMALLRTAAQSPFSLSAADKVRLGEIRTKNPARPSASTPAERAAAAPTGATAQLRKRRAHLDQLAALGYDSVSRDGAEFSLTNSKTGESIRLDGPADAQLARAAIAAHIDAQAHAAAASPRNELAEPTPAQIEAGNYKKGHIANLNGVRIAIENPRDSMRRGVGPDGKPWETKLAHHYGDIEGTHGADGDPVDVFIGPRPDSKKIYVVDQKNRDGSFDEHKVMMGFTSLEAARAGYLANYDAGWTGLMAITEMTPEQFKTWVNSAAAKKPAYESSTSAVTINDGGHNVTLPLVSDEQLAETASPVRGEKSKRTTKAQAAVLRAVAKAFGKRVEFFTDPEGKIRSDGFVREGDASTIYLNASSTISPLSVLGHELLHQVRAENPAAYDAIAAVVQSRITDSGEFLRSYGDESLGHDDMVEELVADLNGDLMGDASFWRDVFAKIQEENGADAKGIIAKLADLIERLIARATDAFKGAKQFGSDKFITDAAAVRAALRDGLATYIQEANVPKAAMQAELLRAGQAAKSSLKRTEIADPESRTTVSTAQPTAKAKKGYQPNSYTEDRVIDAADITASKKHVDQISAALRKYNTLSGKGNPAQLMKELHKTVVDNLSWLFDHVKPEVRERAKLWYDGANRIAKDWTKKFGVNLRQTSGVLAVLSPQMDWFKNVSLGERVLAVLHDHGGERWTDGMTRWADSWLASSKTTDEKAARAADVAQMHRIADEGKTLSEMSPADAAYFVRAFDEAYYPRSYRLVTPEGGFGDFVQNDDGKLASITWGGFGSIEKAVTLYRDPTFRAVDRELGGEHKVRNFYNNIVDPTSADGHVTIDTHAVAAALLKPLSGSSKEVLDNLGGLGSTAATGASGSYGLYADAYRDAAAQKGVLAREMQSITWEAIRAMFPGELKKGMAAKVSAVWDRVRAGEIDRTQARNEILTISKEAGAVDQFAWENGGAGSFAADGATSFENAVAADPAERQVRTLEPRDAKDKMRVSLSAATTKIPGIDALNKLAGKGDTLAHQLLQDVAQDNLKHLLAGTSARIQVERATGLYAGEAEPSLAMTVTFTDHDRGSVLAALAKFADNFNQEQVHVRQATKAKMGTKFDDGSYVTSVYRWDLKQAIGRKDVQKVIDKAGLYGMTFGDDFVEAYYVGDPSDEQARAEFRAAIERADAGVGTRAGGAELSTARLWPYGHGQGAIGFDGIRGDVAAGPATRSLTAQRVAAFLNRDGDQPGKVKTFDQAPAVTDEQAAKQRAIADAYEALPDNDLKNPRVKRAYAELGKELIAQYKALPVKVELRQGDGEPYESSAAMRRDVADNNHLFIFATTPETFGPEGVDFTGHPLLEQSGLKDDNGKPLLMNDLLRAVHDYYAHTMAPVAFGPLGEEAAWKNHMAMTQSPWARWALTSETRGQNSWVNFNQAAEGVPVKDRPFARQKAALLPLEHSFTGDAAVDKPMKAFAKELSADKQIGSKPVKKSAARPVLDTNELVDHIAEVSPHKINIEATRKAFDGMSGVLTQVTTKSLKEGHKRDDVAKSQAKEADIAKLDPKTMPPLIVDNGVVVDGNHRLRAAREMGLESVPAYVLHANDSSDVAAARGITKSSERDDGEPPVPKDLGAFHKSLGDQLRAHVEYGRMLARQHEWAYNIGDQLLSTHTGRVYELTGRTFQRVGKIKDNNWQPVYSYKTGRDGEEGSGTGTFRESAIKESKTLKNLTTPTMFSRARDNDDDEPTPPAGGPKGGKPRSDAADRRDAYRWEGQHTSAAGPEFYARNFALVNPIELEVNDFTEDDSRALPMGHASFVDASSKPYHWDIVDRTGSRVGELAGQVNPAGDIVAIHDIESNTRQRGLGRDVVATIAANHGGDVRIIEAVPGAQPFWDKVGAGYYDQHNNTTLDWDSVSGGLAHEDRGDQGQAADGSGGAIPTGEVGELSPEEVERLGLKFSRERWLDGAKPVGDVFDRTDGQASEILEDDEPSLQWYEKSVSATELPKYKVADEEKEAQFSSASSGDMERITGKTPPLLFVRDDGSVKLLDGGHRIRAAQREGGRVTVLFALHDDSVKKSSTRVDDSAEDDKATTAWQSPSASKFDDMVYKAAGQAGRHEARRRGHQDRQGADPDDLERLPPGGAVPRPRRQAHRGLRAHQELQPLVEEMKQRGLTIEPTSTSSCTRATPRRPTRSSPSATPSLAADGGSGMMTADARPTSASSIRRARRARGRAAKVDKIMRAHAPAVRQLPAREPGHRRRLGPRCSSTTSRCSARTRTPAAPALGQGFSDQGPRGQEPHRLDTQGRRHPGQHRHAARAHHRARREEPRCAGAGRAGHGQPEQGVLDVNEVPHEPGLQQRQGRRRGARGQPMFKQRDNVVVAKVAHPGGIHEHAVLFNEDDERAMRMAAALKNLDAANSRAFWARPPRSRATSPRSTPSTTRCSAWST